MASASTGKNLLIVGATGYIGGSILTALLQSPEAPQLKVSALIRNSEQAAKFQSLGVQPIIFKGLDDLQTCRDAAAQNDVVINAASASHDQSAKALIEGLAQRQKATSQEVYMIHTSGTSILGDHPYTGTPNDQKIWSDVKDNLYEMEKSNPERYGQRVTDVTVVETGLSLGVKTYIAVPPTIYGKGSGTFATLSQQVPNLARLAVKKQRALVIDEGKGIWNHVHIEDLASFYALLFRAVLAQPTWLPSGPRGIFFLESGEHTWLQVSQGIAAALHKKGLLTTSNVESVSLADAARELTRGNESLLVEITLASNSRARADFGREFLGWKTDRGLQDFLDHFDDETGAMADELQALKNAA